MCILSYLPPGAQVDADGLFNGGLSNPDGHGFALVSKGYIITGKFLNLDEALTRFVEARERYPEGPALFHSRWATHGGVNVGNVHPFLVGGSHRTVVAHNGILPDEAHPAKDDDRSDTRKFAEEILPQRFRRLDRPGVQQALSHWCGKFNKLVILTVDPRYRQNAYLVNEEAGLWDSYTGLWHSNSDFLDYPSWRRSAGQGAPLTDAGYEDPCIWCGCPGIDGSGYCEECASCQDCGEHVRECMCWTECANGRLSLGEWERQLAR